MSMQYIKCPHCNNAFGPVSVNNNVTMSVVHKTCSKCHKSFTWQGDHGKVRVIKE